jgi:bifunctional DNase/RNase
MKKKLKFSPQQKILMFLVFALFIGVVSLAVSNFLDLTGYVKVDAIDVQGNTLLLGQGCTAIVADTSQERADSITLGLQHKIDQRPNTHDVFVDAFRTFNISIDSVTIDRYDGQFYYSNIILTDGRTVLKIDSRPSDAVAIALRADAPIYLNKTLLTERGKKVC